jgi:hypothetical protein
LARLASTGFLKAVRGFQQTDQIEAVLAERVTTLNAKTQIGRAVGLLSRHSPGTPGVCSLPCSGFTNQISLILESVALGLGFTVIPPFARRAFAQQDAIQVLEGEPAIVDTLWLLHRAEWPLSARAALLPG